MIEIHLTDQEIQDLNEAIDDPSHSEKTKIKLLVIRMRHEGAKTGFIAKCLNLHGNTVTNYLNEFQVGKLPATLEDRYYKPTSSLAPFLECLKCSFRACPVADAKQAVERIQQLSGIRLSESQARRFMKNLGLKLRKTAPVPGKCDHQLQFDFYTREMLPRLEQARLGERKVLFVDAAHFVLGAFLGLIWCFQRIFLKTSPGRQRYNILGAIDSHNQEFTSIRTTENINALTILSLLDLVRKKYPVIPISLIMDNARYQHCNVVKAHAARLDIELLFLPPYSPNLNLIERVWKLTKKKCLTNKYHKDFSSFRAAIDQCLDDFEDRLKPELKSLLALNFQFFPNHKS
jgi:transposase